MAPSSAAAIGDAPDGALPASASLVWKLDTCPDSGSSARMLAGAEVLELAVDGVADSPCTSQNAKFIHDTGCTTPTPALWCACCIVRPRYMDHQGA